MTYLLSDAPLSQNLLPQCFDFKFIQHIFGIITGILQDMFGSGCYGMFLRACDVWLLPLHQFHPRYNLADC
ncbi:hypothetical protein QQP08_017311 [Theobroma cacao]|nr:hypothetical protein QQP08_017311 [Theobroma cacao]